MLSFSTLLRLAGKASLLAASLSPLAQLAQAAPTRNYDDHSALYNKRNDTPPSSGTDRLVFCHFMIGIVSDRTSSADYDDDMQRAKSLGIDAFALNIGVDPYTDTQLGLAYDSANKNGMKVFISFDFNWYHAGSDAAAVGAMIAKYAKLPAQLMVDGKAFASSFAGDALDIPTMRSSAGVDVFFAPNFHPDITADPKNIDAALNWMGWDNNGLNKAPSAGRNVTVKDGDDAYQKWLGSKPYVAPVSAWFSTHFGPEVSYSKNWVFPSDLLWFNRWNDILTMGPRFIEIVTWNDYGESHYIGPLASPHTDDGNSKWVNDMHHDGWLDMAKPYIAAYHAGASKPDDYIKDDELVYWYRPTLRSLDCDATDTTMVTANNQSGNYFEGRPDGWESMQDSVFVVSLLTAPAKVSVTSGGTTKEFDAPAGAAAFEVPMALGKQSFSVTRDSKTILSGDSLKEVSDVCICGIYNFNAYVGTLPEKDLPGLGKDALASLTAGLHVSTCLPTPSLGSGSGVGTAPATATGSSPAGGGSAAPSTAQPATTASATGAAPGSASGSAAPSSQYPATTQAPAPSTQASEPFPTASNSAPAGSVSASPVSASPVSASPVSASPSAAVPTSGTGSGSGSGTCSAGTVAPGMSGNYLGLCQFGCYHGYCPTGVCVCTATGTPQDAPAVTAADAGCPLPGEDDSYAGLCKFACSRGYCPELACRASC